MPALRHRTAALLTAALLVALTPSASDASDPSDVLERGPASTAERGAERLDALLPASAARPAVSGRVRGTDGKNYPSAPTVVVGKQGDYFLGLEFDYACAFGGDLFEKSLRRLGRLADIIEKSGRRVVFTVAPAKSSVLPRRLHNARLPQGRCTKAGLRAQKLLMDRFDHPDYLPLRRQLLRDKRQTYWKTDPHWTSVGGSRFAQALARELSPALGRQQSFLPAESSIVGLLTQLLGEQVTETAPAVTSGDGVTVSPVPGQPSWVGFPYLLYDHSWTAAPEDRTWAGNTVVIGDSFSEFAMGTLRPLFRSGRFLWNGHVPVGTILQGIHDADTVVIESYQLAVPTLELAQNRFIKQVRRTLGVRR